MSCGASIPEPIVCVEYYVFYFRAKVFWSDNSSSFILDKRGKQKPSEILQSLFLCLYPVSDPEVNDMYLPSTVC